MNGHIAASLQRRVTVRTPENIELSYALAGAGTRAAAYFIDVMLMLLLASMFNNLLTAIVVALPAPYAVWGMALYGLVLFVLFNSYFILFEWLMNGQTPGKRAVGLRVIKRGGYALRFLDTLLRNLLRWVDFLPAFYGVGLLSVLLTRDSQRLGDLVAGTLVVYRDEVASDRLLPELPASGELPADWTPARLSAAPQELVEACVEFFRMVPELAPRYRQQLAAALAALVRRTGGLAHDPRRSDEALLAAVIRQSEQTAPSSPAPPP